MPKKTTCEVEFEKWWEKRRMEIYNPSHRKLLEEIWNQAWKTCGDKIMESIKRK